MNKIAANRYSSDNMSDTKKILRQRARELAVIPEKKYNPADFLEVMEFEISGNHYLLELEYIKEVYQPQQISFLPCVPDYVSGIFNLRGQICSLVNINRFLSNSSDSEKYKDIIVIILSNGEMSFGISADKICGIRNIEIDNQINYDLSQIRDNSDDYIKYISREKLVLLDAEKILKDKRLIVDD